MGFILLNTNTYVPWDTAYLDRYATNVRGAIGSSVNTGIVILAIIMGVLVVIKVIKMFSK